MGKSISLIVGLVAVMAIAWFAYNSVSVHPTPQAEIPNVSITDGQLPQADIDVRTTDVETETKSSELPTVDLTSPAVDGAAPAN